MRLILINGNIHTMNLERDVVEAVVVEGNGIVKVGTREEVLLYLTVDSKIIDLKSRTVLPGFNDSHVHLLNYAYGLRKINLDSVKSIEELVEVGKKYILDSNPNKEQWILGRGWNQVEFRKRREPTKNDLDRISMEYPICLTRICEHVVVVNSKALDVLGITGKTPQPEGGRFDLGLDGEPTGIFREAARYLVYKGVPDYDKDEIKSMISEAARVASRLGITSVQTDDFETFASKDYEKIIQAYLELKEENGLPVRIYEQCLLPDIERLDEFLNRGYHTGWGDERFKIGPLKLLTDGSLGARTALLKEPYSDDKGTRGIGVFSQEYLDGLVATAHVRCMKILAHAIGDGAVAMCLESFKKAQRIMYDDDHRFGLLHIQILNKESIDEIKELGVVAYIEPICVNSDLHMAEDRVGPERLKTSYDYKELVRKEIPYCISSDSPVDSLNPMDSIFVAVNRKDYQGYPEDGWDIEKGLTVDEAVYGFTMGSAYASFEENIKGSIEDGKLADLVVLSENIFEINSEDLRRVYVEMTIMDGEIVYSNGRFGY